MNDDFIDFLASSLCVVQDPDMRDETTIGAGLMTEMWLSPRFSFVPDNIWHDTEQFCSYIQ